MYNCKTLFDLRVRNSPYLKDNNVIGIIPKGGTIKIKSIKGMWIEHEMGYSLYCDESEMLVDLSDDIISLIKNESNVVNKSKLREIFLSTNDISLYSDINNFYSNYSIIHNSYNEIDVAFDSGYTYNECIENNIIPSYVNEHSFNNTLSIINNLKDKFISNFNIKINTMSDLKIYIDNYINFMNNNSISDPIVPKTILPLNKISRSVESENIDEIDSLDQESMTYLYDNGKDLSKIESKPNNLRGIFGVPYQYDDISDPSYEDSSNSIGWKFYNTYITRSPLLYLTPVKPKFMPGFSKDDKNNLLTAIFNNDESALSLFLNDSKSGARYFSTKFATKEYYDRFDTLARALAMYLGIGDIVIPGLGKLRTGFFENYISSSSKGVSSYFGDKNTLIYYVESINTITETHSNETTQSKLEGQLNSVSDIVNEISFIGGAATGGLPSFIENPIENVGSLVNDFIGKFGVLGKRVSEALNAISKGGKLILPEIWSNSDFSFTGGNTFNIKLVAQNPCKLGWFFDIGLPYMSLVALVSPHNIDNNSYSSPFMVKAYCKSSISMDMGIISSLEIKKGDIGKWTVDGLPTEVEITIDIKNLYSSMSISRSTSELSTNSFCLDYLANIAGVNINKPSFERTVELFKVGLNETFSPRMFSRYIGLKLEELSNNLTMDVISWVTGR